MTAEDAGIKSFSPISDWMLKALQTLLALSNSKYMLFTIGNFVEVRQLLEQTERV